MNRTCELCNKTFKRTDHFKKHTAEKICQKVKPVKTCSFCNKTFVRTDDFKKHTEKKICRKQEYTICRQCGVITCPIDNIEHSCKKIHCPKCDNYFYNEYYLSMHLCGEDKYLSDRNRCVHSLFISECLRCNNSLMPLEKLYKHRRCIKCNKHVPFYYCYFNRGDGMLGKTKFNGECGPYKCRGA